MGLYFKILGTCVHLPKHLLFSLSILLGLPIAGRPSSASAQHPAAARYTPQRQKALFYLCNWEHGMGGWKKKTKDRKARRRMPGS